MYTFKGFNKIYQPSPDINKITKFNYVYEN